ncbi:MAG: hypothetical protein V3U84_04615 [Thiotrichaceae bacterium]
MKAFKATYTPHEGRKVKGSRVDGSDAPRIVLIVKICEPEPKSLPCPRVIFIDSDGKLDMDTMDCFSGCQWEEGIKVVGNIYENK